MKTRRKYIKNLNRWPLSLAITEKISANKQRNRILSQTSPGRAFPGHGNPKQTEEQKEIAKLKKELRETQMD
jgi:hypothetical protein